MNFSQNVYFYRFKLKLTKSVFVTFFTKFIIFISLIKKFGNILRFFVYFLNVHYTLYNVQMYLFTDLIKIYLRHCGLILEGFFIYRRTGVWCIFRRYSIIVFNPSKMAKYGSNTLICLVLFAFRFWFDGQKKRENFFFL